MGVRASLCRFRSLSLRARADRRGAAAVEFALVSVMFVTALLCVIGVGLIIFLQQQLDRATDVAARQVMNGTVQKLGASADAFRTQIVCALLPSFISCNDVIVNVWTVTKGTSPGGYYAYVNAGATGLTIPQLSNGTASFSPGVQGSYEYVQVIFPVTFLPRLVTGLFSAQTYGGVPAYLAVSTAAFRNEQY